MNTTRTLATSASLAASALANHASEAAVKNIVLVHGGFVDGSGWAQVYQGLRKDGYNVTAVQNPTITLTDDVATTKLMISQQSGPVILVGHSYGGAVITEAGTDPNVKALVYIAAFAPDKGESVQTLLGTAPKDATPPPILAPQNGFLFLDRAKFVSAFAADVAPADAAFMADSQVPWGVNCLAGVISDPAWRSKRSWYLITTEDKMIPPALQRQMATRANATVSETKGSHAIYVSQPQAVIKLIEQAAMASD
jgi:pimeloyl-ACP methyl ester carboxylesterase